MKRTGILLFAVAGLLGAVIAALFAWRFRTSLPALLCWALGGGGVVLFSYVKHRGYQRHHREQPAGQEPLAVFDKQFAVELQRQQLAKLFDRFANHAVVGLLQCDRTGLEQ